MFNFSFLPYCFIFVLFQVLIVYNFACSVLSIYTLFGFIYALYESDGIYSRATSENLTAIFKIYWLTKNIELLDTVFMVLRHRTRQITFLHIYHHASMVLLSDYARLYTPWPAIAVVLALNSMVHVVLYLYYGLAALNPGNPPPWKQRLTELQIIQFFIDMIYGAIGYKSYGFCVYGHFYGMLMTYLFCNFYYHAYIKRKPIKAKSS